MKKILQIAENNQRRAWQVILDTRIVEAWNAVGAEVNLVGSLKTGLLMDNLDIDFHIYTSPLFIEDSFKAMWKIANNPGVKRIRYENLLDTEEDCLEWHAWFEDQGGDTWQIDMIHLRYRSPNAGRFERVADRINEVLTKETQEAILVIKHAAPEGQKVKGIEVTMAVIQDGVKSYEDFVKWQERNPQPAIIDWLP